VRLGPYVTFPLLIWAGLRFGPIGASAASLIVAAIATWHAALGQGPFVLEAPSGVDAALQVHTFLAVASLCGLIPAAVRQAPHGLARWHGSLDQQRGPHHVRSKRQSGARRRHRDRGYRTPPARGAIPPIAEDGGRGPIGGRRRSRFQQSPHRDPGVRLDAQRG